jgi:hypothetical protein
LSTNHKLSAKDVDFDFHCFEAGKTDFQPTFQTNPILTTINGTDTDTEKFATQWTSIEILVAFPLAFELNNSPVMTHAIGPIVEAVNLIIHACF